MLENGGNKVCSSCRENKPATAEFFCKNRCTQDGLQNVCKPCKATMTKNWKYALESGKFDKLVREQEGLCAICENPLVDPVIDHCHASGRLRQILCRKCNALLGMAGDSLTILENAIEYLKRWR